MRYFVLMACWCLFACEPAAKKAGGHIYFVAKSIGPSLNVYSVAHGQPAKKYTDSDRWRDAQFDVAADGSVYFSSNRREPGEPRHPLNRQKFDVFKSSGSETEVARVMPGNKTKMWPKLSHSGDWLAYKAIEQSSKMEFLTLLNVTTKQAHIVHTAKNISAFAWKRQCECLTYAIFDDGLSELRSFDLKAKKDTLLYAKPLESVQIVDMQWSYTDNYLAMVFNRLNVNYDLKLMVLDPNNPEPLRQVSKNGQVVQTFFNWSPVADQLLFSALIDFKFYFDETTRRKVYEGEMRVFSTGALGGPVIQQTFGPGLQNRPVFSPDGTQFAYIAMQKFAEDRASLMVRPVTSSAPKGNSGEARDQAQLWYEGVAATSRLLWRNLQRGDSK